MAFHPRVERLFCCLIAARRVSTDGIAMTITVTLFAWLRELSGREAYDLVLPAGATAHEAREALLIRCPLLQPWIGRARPAVNQAYGEWDMALADGDELALIPPVSGG